MKTEIKKIEALSRKLIVTLPIDQLNNRVEKELKSVSKNINLDGFRKGKVPKSVVEKKYGKGIKQEEANKLVNETLYQAFASEKTSPAATPKLTNIDFSGDNFIYEIEFDIFPEIKLKKISSLKVEKINAKIQESDIDSTIKKLQNSIAEYKEIDTKSVDGNRLNIDFVGSIKGKEFQGGSAKNHSLVLGSKSMIEGFESGLIGAKKGDEVKLKLKFPKDYQAEELAGKKVEFLVTVNKVEEAILPELNDDFAKKYNEKSIDSLRENLKTHMEKELTDRVNFKNKDNAFNALLDANKFDVPQSSVSEEAQNLLKDTESRMQQQNLPNKGNLDVNIFNDEATRRIKLGLLVAKVVEENKLIVEDKMINEHIEMLSKAYPEEQAKQMIDWYHKDKNRYEGIRSLLLEKEVENFVFNTAKVKEVTKTFDEVFG
ncbi:Cell division trigger factor [hydrothermal vent metagenome]|uniref:peptidylprolyl isomerase n=1 Tax=hydrothermal vent metagenome TaxID=652676 RepID=A0A1W1CMB2_9ZZZZ